MSFDLARVTEAFFDNAGVVGKIDPAIARALSRFGAFVRTRARSLLRYTKGAAMPGQPPHVHRSADFTRRKNVKGRVTQQPASALRELLYFAYDAINRSVVVGPTAGGPRTGAPERTEKGGVGVVGKGANRRTARYKPRPFMAPAFEAELPSAPDNFHDLIR